MAINPKDYMFLAVNDGEEMLLEKIIASMKDGIYCERCKYYAGFPADVCSAFPQGIPQKYSYGPNQHKQVDEGQVGDFIFKEKI